MNISASLYAADPLNIAGALADLVPEVESWHFDVMDGQFAPAFGLNIALFERVKILSDKPIDVHLMVNNPDDWAGRFASLGARWIAFHPESSANPQETIRLIQHHGAKAYLAFNLAIQPAEYRLLLDRVDGALILSAPAGGGDFDVSALNKIAQIPAHLPIAFDGKITPSRLALLRANQGDLAIMGAALWPKK